MTKSYDVNGEKQSKTMTKIINTLSNVKEGLFPKTLALNAGVNHSTTRNYLRKLSDRGIVKRMFPRGPYKLVSNETHDIKTFKIHNLRFSHKIRENTAFKAHTEEREFLFGKAKLTACFGETNCKVTGVVSSETPFSLNECIVVGDLFRNMVNEKLGYMPPYDSVLVTSSEFNWDFAGLRIDGANCITIYSLGSFEKLYNKPDVLRYEVRPTPFTLRELLGLLTGGAAYSNNIQRMASIEEKLDSVSRRVSDIGKNVNWLIANKGDYDGKRD